MRLASYEAILRALADDDVPQIEKGRETCLAILRTQPENRFCLRLMGEIEFHRGRGGQAAQWFEKALSLEPDSSELHYNHAQALAMQGEYGQAAQAMHKAAGLDPRNAETLAGLGSMLTKAKDYAAAREAYSRALAIKPEDPDILNGLGILLKYTCELEGAADCFSRALESRPGYLPALSNLGMICHYQGKFERSIAYFRQVLAVKPDYLAALNNLGSALKAVGDLPGAIGTFTQAVALSGKFAEAHNNLSMALLAAGRFDEGWREFEWRWKSTSYADKWQSPGKPLWRGEGVAEKILLVRAEQGFGDMLQFCRYVPLAAARGLRIVLEVHPELVRLMETLPGVSQIITPGQPLPEHDFFCPMMSLPLAFDTRLETIPAKIPYLFASQAAVEEWRGKLPEPNSRLKVGLVWSGNPRSQYTELAATDARRSCDPQLLAPLLEVAGVRFYSLQKFGPPAPVQFHLIDRMGECRDFADTAALITHLDLIVSVDTSVVHLAGALNKPVWLLNRFDSCWRWLQDRQDSPWYPAMRIFRQPRQGDWSSVVLQVRNELRALAGAVQSGDN